MPWARLPDVFETTKMFTEKESVRVNNKYKSLSEMLLSNKTISYKSLVNPRKIQNELIKTQQLRYLLHLETQIVFQILKIQNLTRLFGVVELTEWNKV